jgi:hypothetical protein
MLMILLLQGMMLTKLVTSSDIYKKKIDIKDLEKLKYFLDIEIVYSKKDLFLSQRKYVLDLLQKIRKLGCKPIDTPIEPNIKLGPNDGEALTDISQFQRLVFI